MAKISTWLTVTCIRKLSLPTGFPWSQSFAEFLSSPLGRVFDFYSGYEAGRFSFGASVQTRLQSVLRSSPCTPEHPRHPGSFQSKAQTKYIQRILWGFHPDADRLFFFLSQLRELLVDFKRFKWTKEEDDCLPHLTPAGRKARNFQGGIRWGLIQVWHLKVECTVHSLFHMCPEHDGFVCVALVFTVFTLRWMMRVDVREQKTRPLYCAMYCGCRNWLQTTNSKMRSITTSASIQNLESNSTLCVLWFYHQVRNVNINRILLLLSLKWVLIETANGW